MQITNLLSLIGKKAIILLLLFFVAFGCVVVKQEDNIIGGGAVELSDNPKYTMSDEALRTEEGDLIVYLPPGWFFVDAESYLAAGSLAIAVNPDYTLALVVSRLRPDAQIEQFFAAEGIRGAAKVAFDRRKQRAPAAELTSSFDLLTLAGREIALYNYAASAIGATSVGVVNSSMDNMYEIAITPISFTGNMIPGNDQVREIFSSIMYTMEF